MNLKQALLIIINFFSVVFTADKDAAYQNYLKKCRQVSESAFEHLQIIDLANIVADYYCKRISYEQWQKNNNDLIEAATRRGNLKRVKELLEEADVNAKKEYGSTALIEAACYGHKEIVELLINAKADVNAKNNHGWTALMWAVAYGYKEIVKLLINAKADVNATTNNGNTALMWANGYGHKEIIELLKKAEAKSQKCCIIM